MTDPNSRGLGSKLADGAVWMLVMKAATRILGFASIFVLARLLTPDDFGVSAVAMSCFALIAVFGRFGFDLALIQNQNATASDYDTAWTINLVFCLSAAIVLWLAAPAVARAMEDQRLTEVLQVIAAFYLLTGMQNIGVVDFRKKLEWHREFLFNAVPRLISFFVTIGAALILRSYWALIIGSFSIRGISVILSYVMVSYRPRFSFEAWRRLISFSKWLVARNLLVTLNHRSPELTCAKLISTESAGLVTISSELAMAATAEVVATINRAIFPGYSIIADDVGALKGFYKDVIQAVLLYLLPVAVGIVLLAESFVLVVLGANWLEVIPVLQLLSVSAAMLAMNSNFTYVSTATGNPRIPTIIQVVRFSVLLPGVITGAYYYGVTGAAGGVLVSAIAVNVVTATIAKRAIGLAVSDYIEIYLRPAVATVSMAFAMSGFDDLDVIDGADSPVAYLLSQTAVGGGVYIAVLILVWRIQGRPKSVEKRLLDYFSQKWVELFSAIVRR